MPNTRHEFVSEMPVRTVSQKFIRHQCGKSFTGLWSKPTKTADFGSSFWLIHHTSNVCLLEDEIQNWGMYLFTIFYRGYAMDQRSGVGWISGWSQIFTLYHRNSLSKLWGTRRENCFSTEQNHPEYVSRKRSVWRNKKHQEEYRFLRETDRLPDLQVLPGHWSHVSVENFADPFTISLRNDDIQEFDSKWDGILLSLTKIPHDDILESLYKLRRREFEKLKTVWELYNMQIHQKKVGPDYYRLTTIVRRSIEQNLRENFEARNGNYDTSAVVKNQGTQQRETKGQCSKRDNCSFRHNVNHPPWCSTSPKMDADLEKNAFMHITRLMNSLAKGLKRMVTKVQWPYRKLHDNWVAYFKMISRRSLQRFYGGAQTYGNRSDVFDSQKPLYVMLTFATRIHRSEWFGTSSA